MDYDEAVKRSFTEDQISDVYEILMAIRKIPAGVDGSLYFRNEKGIAIAEFWWNSLIECWMVRLVDKSEEV
jgi:hypothetical protein